MRHSPAVTACPEPRQYDQAFPEEAPFGKVPVLFLVLVPQQRLHIDLGVELVDLISEVVPEVHPLGFEGGSEEAVFH